MRDGLLVRGPWRGGPLFRNVDWVESHVSAETWVGAFQSGTLGFFHDRRLVLASGGGLTALTSPIDPTTGSFVGAGHFAARLTDDGRIVWRRGDEIEGYDHGLVTVLSRTDVTPIGPGVSAADRVGPTIDGLNGKLECALKNADAVMSHGSWYIPDSLKTCGPLRVPSSCPSIRLTGLRLVGSR